VDGPSKAVKLKHAGQTDIVATSVVVVNSTTITCTLNIHSGTATGMWNVEVTNGCSTVGSGIGLFQVTSATGGPKNIPLRPLPAPPPTYSWVQDLAVDPADGNLYILYQDREIWRYPASDYTTGALLTLPPNPYGTSTVLYGFIDVSPNHWAAVGFRRGDATSPRSAWQHIDLTSPSTVVLNSTTMQLAYVFGDVVAFNSTGAYAQDHLNISGVSAGSGGPYWNVNGLALDTTTYANPTFYNNGNVNFGAATGSVDTYVPTTFRGCEADKSGNYFWALKRYTYATVDPPVETAWCSRFNRNTSNIVTYTNAYFGTGVPGDSDDTFNNPYDITRDDQNRYLVFDRLSTNTLRVKAWNVTVNPGTSLGGMDLTGLAGDPTLAGFRLRADCDDNNATANGNILFIIHGDHTNGFFLSLYYPGEFPW
jgi:hypothetical protein